MHSSLASSSGSRRQPDRTILRQPWLLIYPPAGFGLVWSPKSACTTALLWYLANVGLIREAAEYDPWPHNYRMNVLPKLDMYKQWLAECDPDQLKWVRVIRDPYCRAVSSYRHALRYSFENTKIEEILGLSVNERGFSFDEFLRYLSKIDITTCNPHHRQQLHAVESKLTLTRVVNVDKEPMMQALYEISDPGAEARALLTAEVARIAGLHHANRVTTDNDCSNVVFRASEAGGDWPDYRSFLNKDTRDIIERIYHSDFEAFCSYL